MSMPCVHISVKRLGRLRNREWIVSRSDVVSQNGYNNSDSKRSFTDNKRNWKLLYAGTFQILNMQTRQICDLCSIDDMPIIQNNNRNIWYRQRPETVTESLKVTTLWELAIHTASIATIIWRYLSTRDRDFQKKKRSGNKVTTLWNKKPESVSLIVHTLGMLKNKTKKQVYNKTIIRYEYIKHVENSTFNHCILPI